MILRHNDLNVPTEPGTNPFENCKLGREKYGNILTKIVGSYADGFVLAIDNKWGTGKTTFIRMWRQQLINNGFKTIQFNAWEHDFDDKPLPAILAELKELVGSDKSELFKNVSQKASTIAKKVLPAAAKALAKYFGADELLQDIAEAGTEGASDILDEEINEYTKKKKGLVEFRKALSEYVKDIKGDKPLVFIIDELDRCRPNYAVEVLEQIKHFFSVSGIVFVLSIDKVQLGHAVRGVYGSESIDADEYLRRFIDVEYSLPQPLFRNYCDYLSQYYELETFFESKDRKLALGLGDEIKSFNSFVSALFESSELTLRQVEKLFVIFRIMLNRYKKESEVYLEALIFLIYCKYYQSAFFDMFSNHKISTDNFCSEFNKVIPQKRSHKTNQTYLTVEAALIYLYESMFTSNPSASLVIQENEEFISKHKSELGFTQQQFGREILNFISRYNITDRTARYLIEVINNYGGIVP